MAKRGRRRKNDDTALLADTGVFGEQVEPAERKPGIALSDEETQKLLREYMDAVSGALLARADQESRWLEWLRLYRSRPKTDFKTYPWQGCANLVTPLAAIYVNTMDARIMQSVFGTEPPWVAIEINRKAAESAKPIERWLEWNSQHLWNQWETVHLWVLDLLKFGTAIILNGFLDEVCYRYDENTGTTVSAGRKFGPMPRWLPREDFIIPEGYDSVAAAPWVAHRDWFSPADLESAGQRGYFDPEAVKKVLGEAPDQDQTRDARREDATRTSTPVADDKFGPRAVWTVSFRRDLDKDGYPEAHEVSFHLESGTLMRLRANPYVSGMRRYTVGKFIEVEGEFDGIGIPELVEQLQEEASTIHNQRRDNAHLSNIRMYKGKVTSNLPDSIRPESGKVIKVLDPNDLEEWKLGDNRQADIYEESVVQQLADKLVGLSDINFGKESSPLGRAAATTVMALLQEGTRRFDLNTSVIRKALGDQAHQLIELWQTHGLPEPDWSGSPESVLDEDDAAMVRMVIEQRDDIRGLLSLRLNASTAAVNREVEKQSTVQLMGIVTQYGQQVMQLLPILTNPQIPPETKAIPVKFIEAQDKMLTKVFQAFGAFDLESVLVGDIFAQMAQPQGPLAIPGPEQIGGPGGAPAGGSPAAMFGINPAALVGAIGGNGRG